MAVFRRRRRLALVFVACAGLFLFSLLSVGNVSTLEGMQHGLATSGNDDDDGLSNYQQLLKQEDATRNGAGFFIKGSNSTGDGVVVQLWPKNSLDLVQNAYRKAQEKEKKRRALAGKGEVVGGTGQANSNKGRMVESPVPISEYMAPCSPNNVECIRFRHLLKSWPSGKPRAAFYFLTQPSRLANFRQVLTSVDAYFNSRFHYPIIVFHEADLVPYIPAIRKFTSSNLYFQEISFSIPDFLKGPVKDNIPCSNRIGYRHMCRFHAKGVFQQPIMRGLDYYWRLDDDSLLLREVNYDVFRYMADHQFVYGYSWQHWDNLKCTEGLWQATRTYINRTGIKPHFFHEWEEPQIYYNNFEITSLSVWLSVDYARYIEYVDQLGGIYYHRWGDAPIKSIAVSLFVPKKQVYRFQDIGYKHASYINK